MSEDKRQVNSGLKKSSEESRRADRERGTSKSDRRKNVDTSPRRPHNWGEGEAIPLGQGSGKVRMTFGRISSSGKKIAVHKKGAHHGQCALLWQDRIRANIDQSRSKKRKAKKESF